MMSAVGHVFGQSLRTNLSFVIGRLQAIKEISNHERIGWGSANNEFYNLSKELLKMRMEKDFRQMITNSSPVVRAMGLLCLTQMNEDERYSTLSPFIEDPERVSLAEGCMISTITIGEFARRLLANPYFLEPGGRPSCDPAFPSCFYSGVAL